jgi:hypothetical protein
MDCKKKKKQKYEIYRANRERCGVIHSTIRANTLSTSSLIKPLLSPFLASRALAVISTS